MSKNTVLIVDDELDIRELVCDILTDQGFTCFKAANSDEALKLIDKELPSIVLLDIWLQDSNLDGLGILEIIKAKYHFISTIMISGHGTIETAVTSIKMGAYDYIEKPFNSEKLIVTVNRAIEAIKLKRENIELKKKIVRKVELTGNSNIITQLKAIVEKAALTSNRILICGESGSGRELVAKLIHRTAQKSSGTFVKLHTASLANEKLQKELFEGNSNKLGLLDLTNNGTLFINEVGNLSLHAQHAILTMMKELSKNESKYNIRIIASTTQDLKKAVKAGMFLQDLFNRLNEFTIEVPSLHERVEDIAELCTNFINYFENNSNLARKSIDADVIVKLQEYTWPGSIRQLKNLIEWLLIVAQLHKSETITTDMLPEHILQHDTKTRVVKGGFELDASIISMPLREAREMFEKTYLAAQMEKFKNNISKTSTSVGMERSALHRKLRALNICPSEEKAYNTD